MSTPSPVDMRPPEERTFEGTHRDCGEYPLPLPRPITAVDAAMISVSVVFTTLTILRLCGLLG